MNTTTTTQFVPTRRMGICEPIHHMNMWADFKGGNICVQTSPHMIHNNQDNQSENTSNGTVGACNNYDQEASKPDKVLRRQAQNREAARKSRLRKKAYVQQLESSKLRLVQLEQELERARQQGLYAGTGLDSSQLVMSNPGIAAFEMEYGHWVEEHNRQITELRNALCSDISDVELQIIVDGGAKHYYNLFDMKSVVAKVDVFYLMSGVWKTSAERFFFWIGGFRPSELLKVIEPHLESLSEEQCLDACNLRQSCHQVEDALSQGIDKLHHIVAESIGLQLGEENYLPQIRSAMDKLDALVRFLDQADRLRQETLQQILRILTTRQAARGLLVLGEYLQRLRTLGSLWSSRHQETEQTIVQIS